jgi:VWFA-related protein
MSSTTMKSAIAVAVLAAGGFAAHAPTRTVAAQQQQSPPAVPPGATAAQTQTQKPTFRIQIDLVTTDVIARDKKGQFLADLKNDEFEVYEDGVKQDIVSMVLNHGGRVNNVLALAPAAPQEGIILPPSRPSNDAAGRIYVFFIDDLHLQFANTARVRVALMKMKKELLHEGDMFAIQTTGPSSVMVDLTYDLKRFDEAVKKISGSELKPAEIVQAPEGAEGPSEVRYRAHVAFSTVNDLLAVLEQVRNRRKALIYLSDGYDFNPFEKSRYQTGQQNSGQASADAAAQNAGTAGDFGDPWTRASTRFAEADLVREIADLTRTANRANVTMYTIDPRGLVAGYDMDEQVDPMEWLDFIRNSQDGLRVLAEQTGGFAIINTNDITPALKRIDAETSDYYVLGFYSKNPDPLKRRRLIDVKVTRPNVDVWARKEYQLKRLPRPEDAVKK